MIDIGRVDRQGKINAMRFDLSEVDATLNAVDGVREVRSVVVKDENPNSARFGRACVVAFVVPASKAPECYERAIHELSPHKRPVTVIGIKGALPSNATGTKVDETALQLEARDALKAGEFSELSHADSTVRADAHVQTLTHVGELFLGIVNNTLGTNFLSKQLATRRTDCERS